MSDILERLESWSELQVCKKAGIDKILIEARDEIEQLRNALSELVALKSIKDMYGKTDSYIKRQPKAWEVARAVLTKGCDHSWSNPSKDAPPITCLKCGAPKGVHVESEQDND